MNSFIKIWRGDDEPGACKTVGGNLHGVVHAENLMEQDDTGQRSFAYPAQVQSDIRLRRGQLCIQCHASGAPSFYPVCCASRLAALDQDRCGSFPVFVWLRSGEVIQTQNH